MAVCANIRAADHCFGQNPIRAENAFVAPDKFAEESPMTLRVNLSRKNFHARNPRFIDIALLPVCAPQVQRPRRLDERAPAQKRRCDNRERSVHFERQG